MITKNITVILETENSNKMMRIIIKIWWGRNLPTRIGSKWWGRRFL